MKINFNSNIARYNPQFKATFAKDKNTQEILKQWIDEDPEATLALKFALEDSSDNSSIKIIKRPVRVCYNECSCYELRHCNREYNQSPLVDSESWDTELLEILCENEKNSEGVSFLDSTPKCYYEYIHKAKELLEGTSMGIKRKNLESKVLKLREKLETINTTFNKKAIEIAKKHIL